MGTAALVTSQFRLQAILDSSDPPVSQSELSRHSGVSLTTINRMVNNLTAQVSLRTLDSLSASLSELLGRTVAPGDLIERIADKRGRRG
jgi:DNA-binding Xre family transcriptional regulator